MQNKSVKKTSKNFIHVICHLELLRTFVVRRNTAISSHPAPHLSFFLFTVEDTFCKAGCSFAPANKASNLPTLPRTISEGGATSAGHLSLSKDIKINKYYSWRSYCLTARDAMLPYVFYPVDLRSVSSLFILSNSSPTCHI